MAHFMFQPAFHILGFLSIQQATVSGNLLFQTGLDVQEDIIFMVLVLHVTSQFSQLLLQACDQNLDLGKLGAIAGFCLGLGVFQYRFLGKEKWLDGSESLFKFVTLGCQV